VIKTAPQPGARHSAGLMETNRIVEPLAFFYKTKSARWGANWACPTGCWSGIRSGAGLAIRCLCAEADQPLRQEPKAG